jgi:hypothetical protein
MEAITKSDSPEMTRDVRKESKFKHQGNKTK